MIIVTDGAVDLPAWLEESPAIRKVSGRLWLGNDPLQGGTEQFWSLVRDHQYPSTTPPTVSDLTEAYRHHDLVIGLHVSAILSATASHAREAATRAGPGAIVIDTRSFSVGAGLVVAAVHRALESPLEYESIIEYARSLPDRLHTFALIEEIETLRRSDRSGLLPPGRLAKNHPLLLAAHGRAMPLGQFKSRDAALRRLVWHLESERGAGLGRSLGYRTRRRCRRDSAHESDIKSHRFTSSFCDPSRSDSRSAPWSGFRCRWSDLGSR